jgi:hypothetical protein
MAQTQAVMAIMDKNPDLFNKKAVIQRFLKQIKVPGVNELMIDTPPPVKMDAANENVAMAIGQAAFAYPEQDHFGHIQVILDFAKNPALGANPVIAPAYLPKAVEHIKQHLTLWYLSNVDKYTSEALGRKFDIMKIQPIMQEAQKLISVASQQVHMDSAQNLQQQVMPIIQQMLATVQKMKGQSNVPPDPNVMAQVKALQETAMAETQRKTAKDQADMEFKRQDMMAISQEKANELQAKVLMNTEDNLTEERIKTAELTRDAARLQNEQMQTAIDAQNKLQSDLGGRNV